MLLTISTSRQPATDLGYLLHKSPGRVHRFELAFGEAVVFYPEASDQRCTAALLVDVDPVGLVRGRPGSSGTGLLREYVNDRPYAASSLMSTALSRVFGTALGGRSRTRPELADTAIPLEARLPVVPIRGGASFIKSLFEPLGYAVDAHPLPLDPARPDWGDSAYHEVALTATLRLRDLLTHLYVLLPVLDDDKHYWVGSDEIEKLLRKGEGWLDSHPAREEIVRRYLRRKEPFVREALARLLEADNTVGSEEERDEAPEEAIEAPMSLAEQRLGTVISALRSADARRVLDLGCGEGRLLIRLARGANFEQLLGVDVALRPLALARRSIERLPERVRQRIEVVQGSLLYRDVRLTGWDAAVLMEVIEHVEPGRLPVLAQNVFGFAAPRVVVLTTPNAEYNRLFEGLEQGTFRHADHRFEWTRAELEAWVREICSGFPYRARSLGIGPIDLAAGPPTQIVVFERWT